MNRANPACVARLSLFRPLLMALVALLLATGLGGTARAQGYSFSTVRIEGNSRIETGTILSYAGISRGVPVSAADLNDAYQRLVASGLFEAVDLSPQGGTLVIRVTEYPTINVINIEGNKRLSDDVLLGLVKSQARRVYSPAQAQADAAAMVDAYKIQGRLAATVTPKIIRRGDNRVDLAFEVVEGKVVEVERLSFVGNRDFSDRRLRRVLATKQAGIFRRLIKADTFIADRINFDKQVLRDFYLSRGYIDFQVLSVASEFSREKNATFLTYTVQEGQSYRFGSLTVASEVPEANAADFQDQLKIRSGTVYNPALIDNTITRMEGLATKKGYSFVRVDPRVTRHEREGTLDIQFTLTRGPKIFVERIDIEGNATTLDRVVRSQFRTVEGDPFNPREIRQAAERIRALGFFKTADVQTRPGRASDQVIVDVNVDEQDTGSLSFGGSFSADQGPGLNVAFAESNFLGRGQAIKFDLSTAKGTRNLGFAFADPNVLGRDLVLQLSANYQSTDNFNSNYSSKLGNSSVGVEFPVSAYGRLGVRATLGYSEVFSVDDGDANNDGFNDGDTNKNGVIDGREVLSTGSSAILLREQALGGSFRAGIGYTYGYDTRKTGLDPHGGVLFRFSQDLSGLGGDAKYLRTSVVGLAERRVSNDSVVLRATFEGGALNLFNGTSRITDRFNLSSSTLRGFAYGGVGPRDLAVSNQDALGGNYFAVLRLDTEFPLGLPEEYGIKGGAFMDVGSLWGLDDTAGGPGGTDPVDDSAHLRASLGLSVLWDTPIGPLRLNFSRPLKKESYDKTQNFDFSVQTSF